MLKLDFKKDFKELYNPPSKEVVLVEVPDFRYLMIDGTGDPNTATEYKEAVEALYAIAYALKFIVKKGPAEVDFGVMPLEGLWWTDDMADFSVNNKAIWKWTMLIMQPEYVTAELFEEAIAQTAKKKDLPALSKIRFESFDEGLVAQVMHHGPYADEAPTIERLHGFIKAQGYSLRGKHHEIYLNDPRKTAPEKMRTVLRQPVDR